MPDDDEYLEILDSTIARLRDAALEANVGIHRDEQPAAVLLNLAGRIQEIDGYLKQRIPSRWRVDVDD